MVSNYNWGGSCPSYLNFNNKRYNKRQCTLWQCKFFVSWRDHGRRGQVDPLFFDFSVAYDWLIHDYELFDQYVDICNKIEQGIINWHDWCWEKDGSGTHLFGPGLQWTTQSVNMTQASIDNPSMYVKMAHTQGREVVAIAPCGKVFEYYAVNEAARKLGGNACTIHNACRRVSHVSNYGKFKGWRFYYKSDYK